MAWGRCLPWAFCVMTEEYKPEKLYVPEKGDVALPNGCSLYWKMNEVGGRTYYSDEAGCVAEIWDTAITEDSTLLAAIVQEAHLRKMEQVNKSRGY